VIGKFVFGVLTLSLAACTTVSNKPTISTNYGYACCNDVHSVQFVSLPPRQAIDIKVVEEGPTLDIGAGPGRFAGFELPAAPNQLVRFRSWFNTSMVGPHFDPVAVFLDEHKMAISSDSLNLRFRRYNMAMFGADKLNSHMLGGLRVPPGARYLILATMPADVDAALTLQTAGGESLRISNPQLQTRLDNGYQKLVPKPIGSFELYLFDAADIASVEH
jgi:hypothetical protein